MKQKKTRDILLIVVAIIFVGAMGYFVLIKKPAVVIIPTPVQETSLVYNNIQYGFDFSLPFSWKGYSIISQNWNGTMIDIQTNQSVEGPEILIRHPLWTSLSPRQDIPIMIFTISQWNLIQQERLSVGAAPIPPSELGRNVNYVFAIPARYNFAFLTGFEEVEQIIANNSLHSF